MFLLFPLLGGGGGGGGGGTPIYWLYVYVPLERVWFSRAFGLVWGLVIIKKMV